MAKCINIKHPDFNKLVKETSLHPIILSAKMGKWMTDNNTDEWPTKEQLNIVIPSQPESAQKDKLIYELQNNPNITVSEIEKLIAGWKHVFSAKKFRGKITVLTEDVMRDGFHKKTLADQFIAEINSIIPDLLSLSEHNKYYRDPINKKIIVRKDGSWSIKGIYYTLEVNQKALNEYTSDTQLDINFDDGNVSEQQLEKLKEAYPEVIGNIQTEVPTEYPIEQNLQADRISIRMIYTEAQQVDNFLNKHKTYPWEATKLLDHIKSVVGLSDYQNDLLNLIKNITNINEIKITTIDRSDLDALENGMFKKHSNDYAFIYLDKDTNKRQIYLIRDNLAKPNDASFSFVASTILHEIVHGILYEAVNNPSNEAERELSKAIHSLYRMAKSKSVFKKSPAYSTIHEFISEGLSNHKIVDELKSMEFNWWQRFIRAIVNFFRFNKNDTDGISTNYYDSMFNSIFSYINKTRKLRPLDYSKESLSSEDYKESDYWIKRVSKTSSTKDNAIFLANKLKDGRKSWVSFNKELKEGEEPFISTEHALNVLGLGGIASDLMANQKDLSDMQYNNAYGSIREAVEKYSGRVNLTATAKAELINRLETQFGKDSSVITNAFVYNINRRLYDVVDFVVVHLVEGSPVYSMVNFYESNGKMSTFRDMIMPEKKGLFKPQSQKNRQEIRLTFASGLFRRALEDVYTYSMYFIPVAEDSNKNAILDYSSLVKSNISRSTYFLWSEDFDKARASAYDNINSMVELDISEEVEQKLKEFSTKFQNEPSLSELDKLLQSIITKLNKRAAVSKIYGNKLTSIEISKLISDIITNYENPNKILKDIIVYSHKVLIAAENKLKETDINKNKINKNTLTAYKNMISSFELVKDISQYFINSKLDDKMPVESSLIAESLKALAYIEVEYKRRAINLLVDYLSPYYNRIKVEQLEIYRRDYRLNKYRVDHKVKLDKVPKNFNSSLTEDEYVASRYRENEEAIKDSTRIVIEKELVKGAKDIGYMEMLVDNILDTGDPVVGSFVKSLSILDDSIRKEKEEARNKYLDIIIEFEEYLKGTNKVFTNYEQMYDFMLEKDVHTGELTGHIITKFRSDLLKEREQMFIASEFYTDKEEARRFRSAWLNANMPLDEKAYTDALYEFIKNLMEQNKMTVKEGKVVLNEVIKSKKYIDIKDLVDRKVIREDIGDILFDWILKNQSLYRVPSEEWENKQWNELSKILENKNDPRTKVYNAIIEMNTSADALVPSSRGIGTRLPGVVKQKSERIASGQPLVSMVSDSLSKTFTFQVDDTYRHNEITKETGEVLYFVPIHYNKAIVKRTEEGVIRFDKDNQSFDLFGIYFSYYSSAVEYSKKHSLLAEVDMFRNLMRQRELIKNASISETLKTIKESPSSILTMKGTDPAIIVGGNISEMLDIWINVIIFGQFEKNMGTIPGTNIDIGKLVQALRKYTAVNLLGLNIIQGIANVTLGEINQWIESIAQEYFTPDIYAKAHLDYMKNLPGIVADAYSRRPTNLLNLISQEFDITDVPKVNKIGKMSKLANISAMDLAHITSSSGEHFMRIKFLNSMLYKQRAFNSNGEDIGSIRDFYSLDEKGKLVFDKEGKVDLKLSQWEPLDRENFKQKVEGIMGRIHGDYSNLAKVAIEQNAIGSLAYMFRRFLVPNIRRHWGKQRYEERNMQSVEGMYITFWKQMLKPMWQALKLKRGVEVADSELAELTWGERWAQLSDNERANIHRTWLEMVNIALIMVLLRLLSGDDDEEITYADEFLIYQLLRLKSELMFYISPFAAMKILRSPMASMSVSENISSLFLQAMNPLEVYQRGPWEGQLKIYKKFVNMVPVYRQAYRLRDVGEQIPWFQR